MQEGLIQIQCNWARAFTSNAYVVPVRHCFQLGSWLLSLVCGKLARLDSGCFHWTTDYSFYSASQIEALISSATSSASLLL